MNIEKLPYRWRRWLVRLRRFQERNGGDWHWLSSKPAPVVSLNRDLWRWAEPNLNYYVLLLLSGIISTLGLLANSSATIIGAMIIAPLMGPLTAITFAVVMGNRRLLKRASLTVFTGVVLTVLTATLITWLMGLERLTPEIQARVQPTLIDLGVALAAGAAGAYAKSRKHISDALPGVAIAVALVPPLSVIGIGLAIPLQPVAVGSALLFITNLAGIIFSGSLIFLWQNYGSARKARQPLTLTALLLLALGLPLGLSFRDLLVKEQTRYELSQLVERELEKIGNAEVQQLIVRRQRQGLGVQLEISAPPTTITDTEFRQIHRAMESRLERPIDLDLRVTPVSQFQHP